MLGAMWMNVGSLALGVTAWLLPLLALTWLRRSGGALLLAAGSLTACALSLCLVIFYLGYLTDCGDWSALMDTSRAFRLCAGVLLAGTLALNLLALIRHVGGSARKGADRRG